MHKQPADVQAADEYTNAETAVVLASQESAAFHLVLSGFIYKKKKKKKLSHIIRTIALIM
jgi:hypothetical protein